MTKTTLIAMTAPNCSVVSDPSRVVSTARRLADGDFDEVIVASGRVPADRLTKDDWVALLEDPLAHGGAETARLSIPARGGQPGSQTAIVAAPAAVASTVHSVLDGRRPFLAQPPECSITALAQDGRGRSQLAGYADCSHLARRSPAVERYLAQGVQVIALIRHGRTTANREGRVQGRLCWGMDEVGRQQATQLAEWLGQVDVVISSPVGRALDTARALSVARLQVVDELAEISMGEWEGSLLDEVIERWPENYRSIYELGLDLPRGRVGETWNALATRAVRAIDSIRDTAGGLSLVVTHGAFIAAYVGAIAGAVPVDYGRVQTAENTSLSHVAMDPAGPVLCDYSVVPHLKGSTGDDSELRGLNSRAS